jgi:hypothetical protein
MTVYCFSGDFHDNCESLKYLPKEGIEKHYVLGDIVYGDIEKARACIDGLMQLDPVCVLGFHDRAVFDENARRYFQRQIESRRHPDRNIENLQNAERLGKELGKKYIDWLRQWEERTRVIELDVQEHSPLILTHDVLDPLTVEESRRLGLEGGSKTCIITPYHAKKNYEKANFRLLAHGHTHKPVLWIRPENPEGIAFHEKFDEYKLEPWHRYIFCPGSMDGKSGFAEVCDVDGPKRIGLSVNSYATFDTKTEVLKMHFHIERG